METSRTRVCICYLISTFLISFFIYILVSSNLQNGRQLDRLREEVDEIAHVVLHAAPGSGCGGDSKNLQEIVDAMLKKRLAGIWDDLYVMKKQLRMQECGAKGLFSSHSRSTDGSDVAAAAADAKGALAAPAAKRGVNYAAEELGAKIQEVNAEPVDGCSLVRSLLGLQFSSNPPINLLRSSMEPGNCFGFKRDKAEVTVKLAKEIYVKAFEVEHICQARCPNNDTSSAPRDFEAASIEANSYAMEHNLGQFVFNNTSPQQFYVVKSEVKAQFVRFKFTSNHGHPEFTCVYRVSVFGSEEH